MSMYFSQAEFDNACETVSRAWLGLNEEPAWEDVEVKEKYGSNYLRITCTLDKGLNQRDPETSISEDSEDFNEDDSEALRVGVSRGRGAIVVYDIVHSTSYQVPVLYLTFNGLVKKGLPSPDELYNMLVPSVHKAQIQQVGLMGAISMTEHPITGAPAYFIHPCRTQEAMSAVGGGKTSCPEQYLLLWFGLAGGSVGLNVPVKLAQALSDGP